MRRYKDATTHAVRNVIEPYLAEAGFTRFKSKDFCRLRGDFFDHVYFGFGRWGSDSLYVYYSLHLLTDPITSKNTYHAGGRLSGRWFPQDHEKACLAAADICSAIQEQALPWFAEMNCVEKYQGVWYENGAAIAFSEIARGDYVRACLFLEDYVSDKSDLIYSSGYPGCRDYEYSMDGENRDMAMAALEAIRRGEIEQWKEATRLRNLSEWGIKGSRLESRE